jgi:hypothetical protein
MGSCTTLSSAVGKARRCGSRLSGREQAKICGRKRARLEDLAMGCLRGACHTARISRWSNQAIASRAPTDSSHSNYSYALAGRHRFKFQLRRNSLGEVRAGLGPHPTGRRGLAKPVGELFPSRPRPKRLFVGIGADFVAWLLVRRVRSAPSADPLRDCCDSGARS